MLKKPSKEYDSYMKRLSSIKKKSNREVLWTDWWMILNYEQRGKHASKFPKHKDSILTSSQFASEIQFYQIASQNNKVFEKENEVKLIIQPGLFDPKKGSGQVKMLEELCREMHGNSEPNALLNIQSDADNFWDESECLQPSLKYKNSKSKITSSSTKQLDDLNLNIDKIVNWMNDLSTLLKSCLYSNQRTYNFFPFPTMEPTPQYSYPEIKHRKSSSISSPDSQDTISHKSSDSCSIIDPIPAKPSFHWTAFTPYGPGSLPIKPIASLNWIARGLQQSQQLSAYI